LGGAAFGPHPIGPLAGQGPVPEWLSRFFGWIRY